MLFEGPYVGASGDLSFDVSPVLGFRAPMLMNPASDIHALCQLDRLFRSLRLADYTSDWI